MSEAYIVSAVRTPAGRCRGRSSGGYLAGLAMRTAVERVGVAPDAVVDVLWGCVDQIGVQATNIARTGWPAVGLPESVPGVTVDRQCGRS